MHFHVHAYGTEFYTGGSVVSDSVVIYASLKTRSIISPKQLVIKIHLSLIVPPPVKKGVSFEMRHVDYTHVHCMLVMTDCR